MTKASIISYITARWGDITSPKRLPIKDREVSNALLDELYPTIVSETDLTTNTITTKNSVNTDLHYDIAIIKQGRNVSIKGNITNASGVIISDGADEQFFEITLAEYLPASLSFDFQDENFIISSGKVYAKNIGAMEIKHINITYFTQN